MKLKISLLFIIYSTVLITAISILFSIKSKVIIQNKELNWLNNQISQEKNNIQILKAEFAYLTTPERINNLQKKYLNLKNLDKNHYQILDES
jgi:cell division protein FtsL